MTDHTGILFLVWEVGKCLLPILGLFLLYHSWYEWAERRDLEGVVIGALCLVPLVLPSQLVKLPDEYYVRKAAARARHSQVPYVATPAAPEPEVVHVHHYAKARPVRSEPSTMTWHRKRSSSSRSDRIDMNPVRRIQGSDRSSQPSLRPVMNMQTGKFDMVSSDGYSIPQQ